MLDVGGAARPFPRADWILDLAPYEARGQLGWDGDRAQERFGPDRWVQRDICAREPWPFADGQFDFAVCSHTLEDVRDPVWVASELQRVARAGYVEVPALREELTYGIQGPWVGWGHHHWLIREAGAGLEFIFKHHVVNRRGSHLPAGSADRLTRRAAGDRSLVGGQAGRARALPAHRRRAGRLPGRVCRALERARRGRRATARRAARPAWPAGCARAAEVSRRRCPPPRSPPSWSSFQTRALLLDCLDALADDAAAGRVRVVVVDNGSTDGSVAGRPGARAVGRGPWPRATSASARPST